jgi:hypothetical protein
MTDSKNKEINATLRMKAEDWESLQNIAEAIGMTRTKMLTALARGNLQLQTSSQEKQLLGEFYAS